MGKAIGTVLGAIATGGLSLYGQAGEAVTSDIHDQKYEAKKQVDAAAAQQQQLLNEQQTQADQEAYTAAAVVNRDQSRQRQKTLAASASGRDGTILTSPLGAINNSSTKLKTLLGE